MKSTIEDEATLKVLKRCIISWSLNWPLMLQAMLEIVLLDGPRPLGENYRTMLIVSFEHGATRYTEFMNNNDKLWIARKEELKQMLCEENP